MAQKLFLAIDNIGAMLAVCDILSASNIKFPGYGIDYYWVLQLTPSSTFHAVKSCYQSLHTLLQPIKTKFPGTELALKLVEDAFSMLSNREKHSAYDLKRNACREDYESFNIRALSCQNIASKETISTANNSSVCERGFSSQSLGCTYLVH
nr:chaperone protein dnaj [Quercus suber]